MKIVLRRGAVREVLRSPEVLAELTARGERIRDAAGPGVEVQTWTGRNRGRVTVRTATRAAAVRAHQSRTLQRALLAGRY